MSILNYKAVAFLLLASILVSACRRTQAPEKLVLEPTVPAGYRKIAPAPAETSAQILAQTAAVFRGTIRDVRFTYDDCGGPRTNYIFSDASSLLGSPVTREVSLSVLGGPTPHGTWVRVSEIPSLALNSEYVVFLRNTDWTYSPIVAQLAFRREVAGGRELLVDPSGRVVTGWGENGPVLSAARVSDAVGRQARGYRAAEAREAPPGPSSAEENPNGAVQGGEGNAPPPPPAPPERTGGSPLASAPSREDIARAGLFARPGLSVDAVANEQTASVGSLVAAVTAAAERDRIHIGGRITLVPYWKCWSITPTAPGRR
ncbi:MAG TPA: hypothetical protein VFA28_03575 [Bryobacteraceae bacterium]|nr:hypothetical protein [Bryobacteraceae bacterium]